VRTLVWFRGKDLRLRDHSALSEALAQGDVITVYVADRELFSRNGYEHSPHRVAYLHAALEELSESIRRKGGWLLFLRGKPELLLPRFVAKHQVDQVFAQRMSYPGAREQTMRLVASLGVQLREFDGETLFAPESIRNSSGKPYSVFTPFSKAARRSLELTPPLPLPKALTAPSATVLAEQEGLPTSAELGIRANSALATAGERGARERLRTFIDCTIEQYDTIRDALALAGTSRLSADLTFGALSPRQVWYSVHGAAQPTASRERYLTQLLWREFSYSTLWDRPNLLTAPFLQKFKGFPWRSEPRDFEAWASGLTGFPIVDAAARQLLREGYVHNRARMIAASFLSKDLLLDFRLGEAHYLKYLVDGDMAVNDLGWQWASGTGCDAQPYYRIFNPITQGKKFDPLGDYVRRYVPELARLQTETIHCPWEADEVSLLAAGIRLGKDYPHPIVDHRSAHKRYLALTAEFLGKARQSGQ
jgi:deoxyribodipyrimidine photo-lyase